MANYENKEVRGRILRTLDRAGRHGVSEELLLDLLNDVQYHVSPGVLADHLHYMQGKGKEYIEVEEITVGDITRRIVRITSRGKDLQEGNIPVDPGIRIIR